MNSNRILDLVGPQLQKDEDNMDMSYNRNMNSNDMNMLDLRAMQIFSSLLQIKATLETNTIKCKADICKNIARNVVP